MAVTIKDVAALAGVSPSTVSRTCKNNPSISEETKERVRKAMAELGYEPNFQASNLASQNSRTIGIILPASAKEVYENSFYLEVIRGISQHCNQKQYINTVITGQNEDAPTLTYNTIGRHISKMVYTKVVSNKSPWLQKAQLGGVYCNPASHGEGRFVANDEWLAKLFANGQVATQYVTPAGELSADEEWNVNGSYMNIEGITSPDGRILGKMAHSERRGDGVAVNIYGEQDIKIFESGVEYFK